MKEAITLKIDNQLLNPASESATARIDNFENCVVPGIVENVNASGPVLLMIRPKMRRLSLRWS